MGLTRRHFLMGLTLPGLAMAGCGQDRPSQITLRFWNGFTGPDGTTMLHLVKRFNAENPDVRILMQRTDWSTHYNKLFVAGLGRRAPEIFVLHTSTIVRFAQARFVRPIDDLIHGRDGLEVSDLDANVWQGTEMDVQHYGLPLDVHILGMYYNRRLFREAGIVGPDGQPQPPTDLPGFMAALHKLTRQGSGSSEQWGFVFTNQESNLYNIMRQFGGEFFTPDNSRCIMNGRENVAALQFAVDLIRKDRVAPPPEDFDAWVGFRQGKVGMAFEGIYMLADLQKQTDLEYGGAPVPQLGAHRAVWANSHNLCLRSDLKGAPLRAAWRFLRFLSNNSLDWAAGGQIPIRKSLRSTRRFQEMTVQSAFARQIPYVNYLPRLPFEFEFLTEFDTAIDRTLHGSVAPREALDTATENVNGIIARRREDLLAARGQDR